MTPHPKAPGFPSLSKALCCPARDRTPSEMPVRGGRGARLEDFFRNLLEGLKLLASSSCQLTEDEKKPGLRGASPGW